MKGSGTEKGVSQPVVYEAQWVSLPDGIGGPGVIFINNMNYHPWFIDYPTFSSRLRNEM